MQVSADPGFVNRTVYYGANLVGAQAKEGDSFANLPKSIGISLLDFDLFKDLEDLHSVYRLYDRRHDRELTDVLELHFVELSKFRKDKPGELPTPFEKWLHALKFSEFYMDGSKPLPTELQEEEGIAMALDEMRKAYADEETRVIIELREKARRDEASRLADAKEQEKKAEKRGEKKGEKNGRRKEAIEVARRLHEQGLDVKIILAATGLRPADLPF